MSIDVTTAERATDKRAAALAWAARGFPVFRLQPNGKEPPAGSHGHLEATTDTAQIREWWTDPLTGSPRDENIGCSPRTGRHVILDLDEKEGRQGIKNFADMGGEAAGLVVATPTGGRHVYFTTEEPLRTRTNLARGVDVRSADGYVVAPGSTIDGVPYEIVEDGPPLPIPPEIAEKIGRAADRATPPRIIHTTVEDDQPRNVERFVEACKRALPASPGCWHDMSRDLACEAIRCAVSIDKALEVMAEHWVPRGTGFFEDGRHERWAADVAGSYQWAMQFREHGLYAVPEPAEVFGGVVPAPVVQVSQTAPMGPAWSVCSPVDLDGLEVPAREFLVPDWLSPGHVTTLYADGGTGKSLLALQLMTALATGHPWLGLPVMPCRTIGLFCEDDQGEMHRRQCAINRVLGVGFRDLGNMRWITAVGSDSTLVNFDRDGAMHGTPAFLRLGTESRDFAARLIVCDGTADLFGGNENDRRQVKQFVGTALGALAVHLNAAVLLLAHPSRDGIRTGKLDGASTGWNNAVRSRWTMARAPGAEGEVDPDLRILSRAKSNYAAAGTTLRIRYDRGAFVLPEPLMGDKWHEHQIRSEAVFLSLLNKVNLTGREVSAAKQSQSYAPKIFSLHPDNERFLKSDFEDAMGRLFGRGRIELFDKGKPSRLFKYIRPVAVPSSAA